MREKTKRRLQGISYFLLLFIAFLAFNLARTIGNTFARYLCIAIVFLFGFVVVSELIRTESYKLLDNVVEYSVKKILPRKETTTEIRGCIKCGSTNFLNTNDFEGHSPPICKDCSNKGNPIIFDSFEDYEKFLKARREEVKK